MTINYRGFSNSTRRFELGEVIFGHQPGQGNLCVHRFAEFHRLPEVHGLADVETAWAGQLAAETAENINTSASVMVLPKPAVIPTERSSK
jgi:hypothetical protein